MTLPIIAPIFERMESVVIAYFNRDGDLVRGNAGFTRLCPNPAEFGWRYAMRPAPTDLVLGTAHCDGCVHQGLVTIGDTQGQMRTLTGEIWIDANAMLLVAGYDLSESERVTTSVLDLNNALDAAHRDLIHAHRKLAQREETIRKLSVTDALTGVGNRRHLDEVLPPECERARRYGHPLALVLLDLDHFKLINDQHGHEAGDLVLRDTGELLRGFVRQSDVAVRLGGEEFVVLMPNTTLAEATSAARRLCGAIESHRATALPIVTASLGVAAMVPGDTPSSLLARADAALYRAKESGRNQVAVAG